MKRSMIVLAAILLCAPAFAELTAELTFKTKDAGGYTRMYAEVALAGIADCPNAGSVTIKFTSPDENVAQSSDFEAPWHSCALDVGTAKTRAYRTVRWPNGKKAPGTWKVQVLSGEKVLAEGEYKVE